MPSNKNELFYKRNMHDMTHSIIIHHLLHQTEEKKETD
jgi:hypothetical protein